MILSNINIGARLVTGFEFIFSLLALVIFIGINRMGLLVGKG